MHNREKRFTPVPAASRSRSEWWVGGKKQTLIAMYSWPFLTLALQHRLRCETRRAGVQAPSPSPAQCFPFMPLSYHIVLHPFVSFSHIPRTKPRTQPCPPTPARRSGQKPQERGPKNAPSRLDEIDNIDETDGNLTKSTIFFVDFVVFISLFRIFVDLNLSLSAPYELSKILSEVFRDFQTLSAGSSLINLVRRRLLNWWGVSRPLDFLISEAVLLGNAVLSRTNTGN